MVKDIPPHHPIDSFLHAGSIPSVWCPGCGIGTVVYAFLKALEEKEIDPRRICVVSGFGCTGKVAEYLNIESSNSTDGYVIRHAATRLAENKNSRVVVYSDNADLLKSGAQDFIEMGREGLNLLVIHINNFVYVITEHRVFPITPFMRTSSDNRFELPFNIPHLAESSGATYIARWTPFHAGWLKYSIMDALSRQGFSVIEVISPCLMYYASTWRIGDAVERMKFYDDHTVMKQGESVENLDIRAHDRIIIGKFVN